MSNKTILKFEEVSEQVYGPVRRIVGFVPGKYVVTLIDSAELSANPRSAKAGSVTSDIIESISNTPDLFPFKTKGILLGCCSYKALERSRYELLFADPEVEGVLDGGHNLLAIGLHVLEEAGVDEKTRRSVKTWDRFKEVWLQEVDRVAEVQANLNFVVPVEIVVPADTNDPETVEQFQMSLLEICAARNNNVQLTEETKAHKKGFYEEIRKVLPPELDAKVEWKTNDGGTIKARELVALAWIPLSVLNNLPGGYSVNANQIYRNKAVCVEQFSKLMENKGVSTPEDGNYAHKLHNNSVKSALQILGDLPKLYDQIYAAFPEAYNKAGGKFGSITAVRMYDAQKIKEKNPKYLRRQPKTPYFDKAVSYTCPDGFLIPLVYGLRALIEEKDGKLSWATDPQKFLDKNLGEIMKSYKLVIEMANWDPQKVGKNLSAYDFSYSAFQAQLTRYKASK